MPFPTEEQLRVIQHRGKPMIVVAGPGSGKTRTLVERMMTLLQEDQSREVTFITFTRTSRRDTEAKLFNAFGKEIFERPGLLFPRTSTLHTYAKRLVHQYAYLLSRDASFSILIDSKGERNIVIAEISTDLGLTIDHSKLSEAITAFRATGTWPLDLIVADSMRAAILTRFDELLRLYKTFDMEGVVLAACEILQTSESALPEIFLQVDEYQDLNPIDQKCIDLIRSRPSSQVVIVGDDAQSIYGFRHANYDGVRTLWNSEQWKKITFQDSHRLPPHILNAALDLIKDHGYLGAEMNRKPDNGLRIQVFQCTNPDLQIEAIARDIKVKMDEGRKEGRQAICFKDFLVLCPTTTQVKQAVSRITMDFNLPAHTPSRSSIPEDYWSVVLILRIAENDDPLALRQWLPAAGVTTSEIFNIRNHALEKKMSFSETCYSLHDPRIEAFHANIKHIREAAGNVSSLIEALQLVASIQIPTNFAELLESVRKEDEHLPRMGRILQMIYETFGVLEPEEMIQDSDKILIATMHSAKGLEAEFVYCTWMNSTFMPMADRDLEEERRVLYVALTRAKQDVILTYPEAFDPVRKRRLSLEIISPFLSEIMPHLNVVRTTADAVRSESLLWHRK